MNKRKIKLLAIAPSESIQSQLLDIVSSMDHVEMDAYVGNLYSGVAVSYTHLPVHWPMRP